jgi:NAD(P)-dependent dehydrogenase (short-subunit alcohol dehydrogenase family)
MQLAALIIICSVDPSLASRNLDSHKKNNMENNNAVNNTLNKKKVIVLGGSSGLGLATAKLADAQGADVIIVSSNEVRLQKALTELSCNSTSYVVDLSKEEQIKNFFTQTGKFDHLVYTAAENLSLKGIYDTEIEQAKEFFNLRYWSAFASVKYAAPLLNPGGSISLTSGTAAIRPRAGWSLITSICSAMEGFTRAMAVELAPIRVNCISPGLINTNLWDNIPETDRENMYKMATELSLVKKLGEPEDVALAFLYLMHQKFSTGQTIVVDGGTVLV